VGKTTMENNDIIVKIKPNKREVGGFIHRITVISTVLDRYLTNRAVASSISGIEGYDQ